MNYIKRLEIENDTARHQVDKLEAGIRDLVGYLTSSKFAQDTSVNRDDVLLRLRELTSYAQESADQYSDGRHAALQPADPAKVRLADGSQVWDAEY